MKDREARQKFQYILLDAPAGIELGFQLCASYADRVILVTCPEPAAVRDAARAGEVLELMGKSDVRLVVNRVSKRLFEIMNDRHPVHQKAAQHAPGVWNGDRKHHQDKLHVREDDESAEKLHDMQLHAY